MNSDEFVGKLSEELNIEGKDAAPMVASVSEILAEALQNGRTVSLNGFGEFEVRNEKEHIVVNPSTKQRILVPPALAVHFCPAESLIDKINIIP